MAYTKQLKFDRKTLRLISLLLEHVDLEAIQRKQRSEIEKSKISKAITRIRATAYQNSFDRRKSRAEQRRSPDFDELIEHVIEKYDI